MWYSYLKTALRKHNLRVDLRVYAGDEEQFSEADLSPKVKSMLSSAIVKGLDIIGLVSRFGIDTGNLAKQMAEESKIDIKVIPGQDYISSDGIKAVFYNLRQSIPLNLPIAEAITQSKKQNGKIMLYDLSKSQSKYSEKLAGTQYAPDLVEIYNSHTAAYKDMHTEYPTVICSAARSGSDLENTPVYTEMSRKRLEDLGFLAPEEGSEYVPGYLREETNG